MSDSAWSMFIGFWITVLVLVGLVVGLVFAVPSYCKGYEQGQLDYQKGIIEYKVEEATTDIIRRIR